VDATELRPHANARMGLFHWGESRAGIAKVTGEV